MPGRQLNFSIRGEQYEKAFDGIASQFLSVVRVPRADDYGIDAYCHVRRRLDAISSTAGAAFGVQIRGPGCKLQFGGMSTTGETWKGYEIDWLRALGVPLYLARVSADLSRVDFYSLWPIWLVLARSPAPFRIICEFNDPSNSTFCLSGARQETDGCAGDRITSTVSLGPPLLRVTQKELADPMFNERAAALLGMWVEYDRVTVIRLLLRVAYVQGIREWRTNEFDFPRKLVLKYWMAWGSTPGENIDEICKVFEPVITNLGWHLEHQDDSAAYNLIPALEWLQATGRLVGFGTELLKRLKENQAQGKSPMG